VPGYTYLIRFQLPSTRALGCAASSRDVTAPGCEFPIELRAPGQVPISDVHELILCSSGWPLEADAWRQGRKVQVALLLALARMGIGCHLGDRGGPGSAIFESGLEFFADASGRRTLRRRLGLTVFETEPWPVFLDLGAESYFAPSIDKFAEYFNAALGSQRELSDREALSLDLFHSAFFERSTDAKFLLFVMSIEALLDPQERSEAAQSHVEQLIQLTEGSSTLKCTEKASIRGSLQWLFDESISRTGRHLATQRLGRRKYMGMSAAKFFNHCYSLRSRLVHGHTVRPTHAEIRAAEEVLRTFVADLLCGPTDHGG
jgi:Apea-like HEPN